MVFLKMFQQFSYNIVESGSLSEAMAISFYSEIKRQWETGFHIKVLLSGEGRSFENTFSCSQKPTVDKL